MVVSKSPKSNALFAIFVVALAGCSEKIDSGKLAEAAKAVVNAVDPAAAAKTSEAPVVKTTGLLQEKNFVSELSAKLMAVRTEAVASVKKDTFDIKVTFEQAGLSPQVDHSAVYKTLNAVSASLITQNGYVSVYHEKKDFELIPGYLTMTRIHCNNKACSDAEVKIDWIKKDHKVGDQYQSFTVKTLKLENATTEITAAGQVEIIPQEISYSKISASHDLVGELLSHGMFKLQSSILWIGHVVESEKDLFQLTALYSKDNTEKEFADQIAFQTMKMKLSASGQAEDSMEIDIQFDERDRIIESKVSVSKLELDLEKKTFSATLAKGDFFLDRIESKEAEKKSK